MVGRSKCVLAVGLGLTAFAAIFCIIGFSTPYWIQSDDRFTTISHFVRMGLWEACFEHWSYYKDYEGKQYHGCWWIFSAEYRPIREYLNPPWFMAVQWLCTLCLVMECILVILLILFLIGCCEGRRNYVLLFVLSILTLLSGILTAVAVITFGAMSVNDREWLEKPDQNFLSWSFGMMVFSGFLALFGGVCVLIASMQLRIDKLNEYGSGERYVSQPDHRTYHDYEMKSTRSYNSRSQYY